MDVKKTLYRIASKIAISQDSLFNVPVLKQKDYIATLRVSDDLIEKSYNQYLCQRWLKKRSVNLLTDIASIPLLFFYYFKKNSKIEVSERYKAVFLGMGHKDNLLPEKLTDQYGSVINVSYVGEAFSKDDKRILKEIAKRHPYSIEFILKCLIKIRIYRWVLDMYSPKAIVVSEEYSYTSSVLTYFCRQNHVKHINIMHGEKIYYIRDSFFAFDRCYVWDQYYIDLFKRLKAEPNQFIIAVPPALMLKGNYEKKYDFKYYLGAESKHTLDRVIALLKSLKSRGKRIAVRPHPRYTDIINLKKICGSEIEIEIPSMVNIEESLLSTDAVISLYSTVILQAYNSGIQVVIDNVSDPDKFELLSEREYRFVENKEILWMSDFMEKD